MAVTGKRGVGIPTILLHDGEGTIVSIEMKTGETYRGLLDETEDNMNCVLKDAVRTDLHGNTTRVEQIYLRGSQVLFIVFPDIYPLRLPSSPACLSACLRIACASLLLVVLLDPVGLVIVGCACRTLKHAQARPHVQARQAVEEVQGPDADAGPGRSWRRRPARPGGLHHPER
jgi:small nuclear ribonucleoprotein D3